MIYISVTGSDSAKGTIDDPLSFKSAIFTCRNSENLILLEGEYKITGSILLDKKIVLSSLSGKVKLIVETSPGESAFVISSGDVSIKDIDIEHSITGKSSGSEAILNLQQGSGISIINCSLSYIKYGITSKCKSFTCFGCTFNPKIPGLSRAIVISSQNGPVLIKSCTFIAEGIFDGMESIYCNNAPAKKYERRGELSILGNIMKGKSNRRFVYFETGAEESDSFVLNIQRNYIPSEKALLCLQPNSKNFLSYIRKCTISGNVSSSKEGLVRISTEYTSLGNDLSGIVVSPVFEFMNNTFPEIDPSEKKLVNGVITFPGGTSLPSDVWRLNFPMFRKVSISEEGGDSGEGTTLDPIHNIETAMSLAIDGGTIHVCAEGKEYTVGKDGKLSLTCDTSGFAINVECDGNHIAGCLEDNVFSFISPGNFFMKIIITTPKCLENRKYILVKTTGNSVTKSYLVPGSVNKYSYETSDDKGILQFLDSSEMIGEVLMSLKGNPVTLPNITKWLVLAEGEGIKISIHLVEIPTKTPPGRGLITEARVYSSVPNFAGDLRVDMLKKKITYDESWKVLLSLPEKISLRLELPEGKLAVTVHIDYLAGIFSPIFDNHENDSKMKGFLA